MDKVLIYFVTVIGFVLALLSFFIVIRGKPIPGNDNTPQELEYKGFKIKTNGVVMLLVLSLIVTILPLSLQAMLEKDKPQNASDLEIFITGQVLKSDGTPVKDASVTVTHLRPEQPEKPQSFRTDNSGAFDFTIRKIGEHDRYRIVAAKAGLISQHMIVAPSSMDLKAVLLAERTDGGMQ